MRSFPSSSPSSSPSIDPAVEIVLGSPTSFAPTTSHSTTFDSTPTTTNNLNNTPSFHSLSCSPLPSTWKQSQSSQPSSAPVSLVWFRGHDLRVHDHPALDAAVSLGGPVVALYVLESGAETDGIGEYFRRRSPSPPPQPPISTTQEDLEQDLEHNQDDSLYRNEIEVEHNNEGEKEETDFYSHKGPLSPTSGFSLGRVPRWYLHHSLLVFKQSLSELGITLIIRRVDEPAHTVDQVVAVALALGTKAVFWNKRCKPNVYPVDDAVRERLSQQQILVNDFLSETLIPFPDAKTHGTFDDFQSYTKYCISSLRINPPPRPSNPLIRSQVNALSKQSITQLLSASSYTLNNNNVLPSVHQLNLLHGLNVSENYEPGHVNQIGCKAAMTTLKNFLNHQRFNTFANGQSRRDGMVIGKNLSTSRLSPHMRFGEISPRVLFYSIIDAGVEAYHETNISGLNASRTFIKNLTLREFGYYMLARYPHAAYKPIVPEFNVFPWMDDKDGILRQSWERGLTGFPIVDAAMRQLWREGWLHNKMRFLVASFFVKYLLLPWPIGATYLVRTLVDGDEACNSLGWQWTAGCNSDCFPFSTLINPVSYNSHTCSSQNATEYVRKYVPELANLPDHLLFTPWKATQQDCIKYNINLVGINQYRKITGNRMPPMSEAFSDIACIYPSRIVDLKQAKNRSKDAMYLMRKIFSAQRQMRIIMVEQFSEPINDDDQDDNHRASTYGEYMGKRRNLRHVSSTSYVDKDGMKVNEIDLTNCEPKEGADDDALSDMSSVSYENTPNGTIVGDKNQYHLSSTITRNITAGTSSKRSHEDAATSTTLSVGRELKRPRTTVSSPTATTTTTSNTSSAPNSAQTDQHQHHASKCDLRALCAVVNQRERQSPPKRVTRSPSTSSFDEEEMKYAHVDVVQRKGQTSRRGSNSHSRVKRPRRMSNNNVTSTNGTILKNASSPNRVPVEDLLTSNATGFVESDVMVHANQMADRRFSAITSARNEQLQQRVNSHSNVHQSRSAKNISVSHVGLHNTSAESGLPRLAQVASIQQPMAPSLSNLSSDALLSMANSKASHNPATSTTMSSWMNSVSIHDNLQQQHQQHFQQPADTKQLVMNGMNSNNITSPYIFGSGSGSSNNSRLQEEMNLSSAPSTATYIQQQQHEGYKPNVDNVDGRASSIVPNIYTGMTPIAAAASPMVQSPYQSLSEAAAAAAVAAAGAGAVTTTNPNAQTPQQILIPSYHRPGPDTNNTTSNNAPSAAPSTVATTTATTATPTMTGSYMQPTPTNAHMNVNTATHAHHLHEAAHTHAQHPSHTQHQPPPPPLPPPPPPQLHASQGYFPSTAQPFIWYPTMQPYVDIRTALPTATPMGMSHVLHPATGLPMTTYAAAAAAMCGYGQEHFRHPQLAGAATDEAHQQQQHAHHHHLHQQQQHAAHVHHQHQQHHAAHQHPHHAHMLTMRTAGLIGMNGGNLSAMNPISAAAAAAAAAGPGGTLTATGRGGTAEGGGGRLSTTTGSLITTTNTRGGTNNNNTIRMGGPSTPLEREAIARRMAAMDYHDETYGGKHWEQWQAIALHLLNSYEFNDDTDRETSRAYVRLCVLKDELRDANPNGPRVTVNHCKEVFKILRLPVTGEWDRRGHGGVRGPYVYGCSKRSSTN